MDLTESCATHVQRLYEEDGHGEDEKEDLLEFIELVLQYGVLLRNAGNDSVNDQTFVSVVESVRQLAISVMREREGTRTRRGSASPASFDITEERLAY